MTREFPKNFEGLLQQAHQDQLAIEQRAKDELEKKEARTREWQTYAQSIFEAAKVIGPQLTEKIATKTTLIAKTGKAEGWVLASKDYGTNTREVFVAYVKNDSNVYRQETEIEGRFGVILSTKGVLCPYRAVSQAPSRTIIVSEAYSGWYGEKSSLPAMYIQCKERHSLNADYTIEYGTNLDSNWKNGSPFRATPEYGKVEITLMEVGESLARLAITHDISIDK